MIMVLIDKWLKTVSRLIIYDVPSKNEVYMFVITRILYCFSKMEFRIIQFNGFS